MIILGIDPGYDRLGWAILQKYQRQTHFVEAGLIQTTKHDALPVRLHQVQLGIEAILKQFSPDIAVVEELFFSNNQKSVIAVAQSRGVVLAALEHHGVAIHEYTPNQIKSIVTGSGSADKKAVEKMVRLQVPKIPAGLIDDTLDAVAGAYAYACDQTYGK